MNASRQASFAELSENRQNNFDILRFFLALSVLFSHCFLMLQGDNGTQVVKLGGYAVNCFFVISGFLITQSWMRSRGAGDYLWKRVLRIYPAYIVMALFCALAVGPFFAASPSTYWADLRIKSLVFSIAHFSLTLPAVFPHNPFSSMNGSTWTIAYEFWCYLLVVLLGATLALRRRETVLVLWLAFYALYLRELFGGCHNPQTCVFHGRSLFLVGMLDEWPHFLSCFLAGAVFWLYRDLIPRSPRLMAAALVLLALGLLPGVYGFLKIFPLVGSYALLYFAVSPRQVGKAITRRGDFSYGIYLYAWPCQQIVLAVVGASHLNPYTFFLLASFLTFILAALSWHLVERPCLKLKSPQRVQITEPEAAPLTVKLEEESSRRAEIPN